MKPDQKIEKEILDIYDNWLNSYVDSDFETYSRYLDDQYHFVGSAGNVELLGKKVLPPFLEVTAGQLPAKTEIRNSKRTVKLFGELALITEELDAYFLTGTAWNYRDRFHFSSVMQKKKDGWWFVYQHFSSPYSKAEEGQTNGYGHINEENQKLREAIDRHTVELEQKSRELEVEAALERVRNCGMAMHQSEELAGVIQVVYEELIQLKINTEHAGFIIDSKAREDMHIWLADKNDVPSELYIPYFDSPHWNSFIEAKKKGSPFFANYLTFEEKNSFYEGLFEKVFHPSPEARKFYLECPGLAVSTVLLDSIGLYIENFTGTPYTDAENNILLRFAKVFEQSYTRFLDLQKSEAQARESQIALGLEIVRARALAMQNASELSELVNTLFGELSKLEFKLDNCIIWIVDAESLESKVWIRNQIENSPPDSYSLKNLNHSYQKKIIKEWKNKNPKWIYMLEGDEKKSYDDLLFSETEFASMPKDIQYHMRSQESVCISFSFSNFGGLQTSTEEALSDEEMDVLCRFGKVFDLTYTRFNDLLKAEAQARESETQLALERVRARTMAMQGSEELADVAFILFEQLRSLGGNLWGTGFGLCEDNSQLDEFWFANEKGVFPPVSIPYSIDSTHKQMYDGWKVGKDYLTIEASGEELKSHYDRMMSLPEVRPFFQEILDEGLSFPEWQQWNAAYFKHGYLLIITLEASPDPEILKRFAKVFDQTYTRFLDLKKAEAQAQETRIELSLERIRAQVTGMQVSADLLDIVVTMRSEFANLGHEAHYFWHMRWLPETYEKAMTSGDGTRIGMVMTLPRHIHGDIKPVADWEKGDLSTHVLAMDADAAVNYIHKMITLGDFERVDPQAPTLDDIRHIGGLTFVMARTTHGEIGFSLPGVVTHPSKDAVDTLVRFAGVFDLAYKRFEDLKTAEKDIIEIKAARLKAEEAFTELKAMQSQLVQQEKLASLGQLTAGIAHEIKNPLNFVNNFSELSIELIEEVMEILGKPLEKDSADELEDILGDVKSNLSKIHQHGTRADSIVKSMLQHSRGSSGKREAADINAIIREIVNLAFHGMRAGKKPINVELVFELDASILSLSVIAEDFSRVILNLCQNAFDAMKGNPPDRLARLTVETRRVENQIEISVKDNGPGIPAEIVEKVFQPFFTTKKGTEGTGLGLSLSYDIAKAHGGELTVNTKPGEGSTFKIAIPCSI